MARKPRVQALTLLLPLLAIVVGCSHTIPPPQMKPMPPAQFGKTPPVIEPLNATRKQAQAAEALLPVTLTADLTPVQRSIQAAIPDQFGEANHPLSSDYRWRFKREGEPQVLIQDGLVKYRAVYRGEIESTAARACRLDPVYPVLEGTGRLMLREQNDQELLVTMTDSQTTLSLKPESDNKCNMFNIPVKDQLAELFKQEVIKQEIAQSVERAGYVIPVHLVWERLNEPVAMTVPPANTQLCLYGKVKDFTVGSMKGPVQQTTISGFARQSPAAIYQTPCQRPAATPVKMQIGGAAAATTAEGQPYKVLLSVPVTYALLNQQLQERLFHQQAKLPTTFGDTLLIEHVFASDANGRVLVAVETSGAVNGTLYYWGTPQLEEEGNRIAIPDLQMAMETKAALDEIKVGYWQMVDRELRERIRQAAAIDLSQRVGPLKTAMSGQYRSGPLSVDLLMGRQEAGRVYSTPDALIADLMLQGAASAAGRLPLEQRAQREPSGTVPDATTPPRVSLTPDETIK
ncbi:MAG TPA: DUF4403 family protein [Nitrospira sp.]